MREKLTTTTVNRLKPTDKPYEIVDTDLKGFLLRVQPSGRMTYYFVYRTPKGKKTRIKIGLVGVISVKQARDIATKYAGQVSQGIDVQFEKKAEREQAKLSEKTTLGYFLEHHYAPWVLANRKSGQYTLETLERHFEPWFDHQMHELSTLMVEKWRTERLNDEIQPSTINRCTAALRALLSKALEWDALETHPLEKLKRLRVDDSPNIRYLSAQEEKTLFQALKDRDEELKAARDRGNQFRQARGYDPLPSLRSQRFADYMEPMVLLSLKTGIRRGELFDLLWSDVDFTAKTITIRGAISKSSKTRHIPLSPTALKVLEEWHTQQQEAKPSERVFSNAKGERFDNTNKAWRGILKASGIENFRWHDMRHDFASKLVMKGVPLNTVRELCGHTDMNTTLRYAHLAPEHKAEAVALLG